MSEKFIFPIEAYRRGMNDERDRIVKLLEDRLQEMTMPDGVIYIEATILKQILKSIKEEK
jgi:uncharacterized protein YlaN (UPF0358 family)